MILFFLRSIYVLLLVIFNPTAASVFDTSSQSYVYDQANAHQGTPLVVVDNNIEYVVLSPVCEAENHACVKTIEITVISSHRLQDGTEITITYVFIDTLQDGSVDKFLQDGREIQFNRANQIFSKLLRLLKYKLQEQAVARMTTE